MFRTDERTGLMKSRQALPHKLMFFIRNGVSGKAYPQRRHEIMHSVLSHFRKHGLTRLFLRAVVCLVQRY